jgi:hypothetical protein
VKSFWPPNATMALIVKPRQTGKEEMLLAGSDNSWQLRRLPAGHIEYCVAAGGAACGTAGRVTSRTPVAEGAWTDIAIRDATETISIYVDGHLEATAPSSARPISQHLDLRIGAPFSGTGFFNGLIDEVRVFNLALDGTEIARMHSAGRSGLCVRAPTQKPF